MLTQDFSRSWKGIVSIEAPIRSDAEVSALDEIDLALGPPFKTECVGTALVFGRGREWLWVTHSWDPFLYVTHGRVRAVGGEMDGAQTFRFDLHMGFWLILSFLFAGIVILFEPSAFGLPAGVFFLLGGILWTAMIPRLFVMKVQRLVETAGSS